MKYMTGSSYVPDTYENIQKNSSIYRGGIIFQHDGGKGFGGYFATTKNVNEENGYKLYIIKTHEFGLTHSEVQAMIDEAISK